MFGFFKKRKYTTALDELNAITAEMFRPLLVKKRKTTDEKINEIVRTVMTAFKTATDSKGETISGDSLLKISAMFIKVYDIATPEFFMEHLEYEISLYMTSGLRDDYASDTTHIDGKNNIQFSYDVGLMYETALMYEKGIGVAQDDEQAIFWYLKAAEQGYVTAQNHLGVMYKNGICVSKNNAKAMFWFRKAAEQGCKTGQCNLGLMYRDGDGTEEGDTQAVFWFRKSAEQGYAAGQYHLAFMYAKGRGILRDITQAISLFREAAKQGDVNAQEALRLFGQ